MAENSDVRVVPLRVSQLLPEMLAVQEEEEDYGTESDGEYPDRSFSDGDIVDHNRGFCKSNYKLSEITHPISNRSIKGQQIDNWVEENFYNQTYPNKESHSASKSSKCKVNSTPLKTPNKHNTVSKQVTASGRLVKGGGATPCSSNKNKTPKYMRELLSASKSSTKKTPFRKCLNLDEAFKSSTKAKLFSTSKPHSTPRGDSGVQPTSLDEMFALSLQIADDKSHVAPTEPTHVNKCGASTNRTNHKSVHNMFATPKSVTSNSIIKGCRDSVVTPHEAPETPCTQNRSSYRNQQTPLYTIRERERESSSTHSARRPDSHTSSKENHGVHGGDVNHKKTLFPEYSLGVLKESQNNQNKTPLVNKANGPLTQDNVKRLIAEPRFRHHTPQPLPSRETKHFFVSRDRHVAEKGNINGTETQENVAPVCNTHGSKFNQFGTSRGSSDNLAELYDGIGSDKPAQQQLLEDSYLGRMPTPLSTNLGASSARMGGGTHNGNYLDADKKLKADTSHLLPPDIQRPRQFKMLTIKGKQYIVLGSLGSGGSSEVFKVMDPEDSAMYAVKCVNLAVEQSVAQSYINEIKLLQRLQGSDRVITMHDYEFVEKKRTLYVVLEMGDVDLSKLMKGYRSRESKLPLPILVCYWTEMLTAVRHIHQNGIIHSDLKPANFLLVHGRLKLIDFGIASSLNADATSVLKDSTTGTFNYISPEAVNAGSEGRDQIKISYKSDVWSLGCILYSMLYGRTPFSHITHIMAKIRALCNPDQMIEYPHVAGAPAVLMHALKWCLTHDIKNRPTVQQLIELPYIGDSPGQVPRPVSQFHNKKVPLSIMLKIKNVLSPEELGCVIDILEGR